ncbi:MAG: WD40 repeat domain-containing protein [Treponema sp.]|nr:WD40 repeat domain-containing protein [Treponema sp.]
MKTPYFYRAKKFPRRFFGAFLTLCLTAPLPSQNSFPGGHQGAVTLMLPAGEGRIYSAGADGFIGLWDSGAALGRFQVSPWEISQMAIRPSSGSENPPPTQLAIAESGGSGRYRISVWDYVSRTKLFSLRLNDPVTFLGYSASGTFLMAATSGQAGLVFFDPESGAVLDAPPSSDRISFAVTGKSEKSMLSYSPSGALSYWDFDAGREIRRFTVSRNLNQVLLFGSRRFFAGIGSDGLSVFDAVSGGLIAREKSITRGKLAASDPESTEFFLLQSNKLSRYFLNSMGRLVISEQRDIPQTPGGINSLLLHDGRIVLGGSRGGVYELVSDGGNVSLKPFEAESRLRIVEAAASGNVIAFFGDDKTIGCIPLDYRMLKDGTELTLLPNADSYTRISPAEQPGSKTGRFIFWQSANVRTFPGLWVTAERAPFIARKSVLNKLPLRANLRSVSVFGDTALFLTMRGVLSAVSVKDGESVPNGSPVFSYQAAGSSDAAFLNDKEIILGRGAVSGPPFAKLQAENGETIPVEMADQAGIRLYREKSALYALVSGRENGAVFTRIVRFDDGKLIADYAGEDQDVSLTETRFPAANLGGESATVYNPKGPVGLERSPGFPRRLMNGISFLVVLDTEGNIVWYDPETGTMRAMLSLYGNRWDLALQEGVTVTGSVVR